MADTNVTSKAPHLPGMEAMTGFAAAVLVIFLCAFRFFEPIEMLLLDARFLLRGPRPMPEEVAVIGIDEASLDHPQAGAWPWPRGLHARFLDVLSREEALPAVIGYDLAFEREDIKDEPGDVSLAYQADRLGERLVFACFIEKGFRSRFEKDAAQEKRLENFALRTQSEKPPRLQSYDKISLPFTGLSRTASLGFIDIPREAQGTSRRIRLLAEYRERVYPSFELVMLLRFLGAGVSDVRLTEDSILIEKQGRVLRRIPVTPEGDLLISYYGNPGREKDFVSFIHVVMGDSLLSPSQARGVYRSIKGKAALVGRTAPSLRQSHVTPFNPAEADVLVRAQALGNLIEERYLVRPGIISSCLLTAVLLGLILAASLFLPPGRSFAALCLLEALFFASSYVFFLRGIWLETAVPAFGMAAVFLAVLAFRYFTALEELKRAQGQLVHSTKLAMVGQVSSGMAHEFRNILHAIKLHVEGCTRPGMKPERVQKYMGVIFKTLDNAELMLNGILSFSRKNRSDKKLQFLHKTVEDTLLMLKKEMQYQNIRIIRQFDEVPAVMHDPGQIAQVVMNLVNNSRDALKDRKDKMVALRIRADAKYVYLEIADNGPGLPADVQKNLFKPFVTTKAEGKGTGLGLSVSHGIVRNHGGDLTVTSVPGQGTVWHIALPL